MRGTVAPAPLRRRIPVGPRPGPQGDLGWWAPLRVACLGFAGTACGRAEPPREPELAALVPRLFGSDREDVNSAARRLVEIGAPALESLKLPPTAPYYQRSPAIEVMGWMGAAAEPAVPWLMDLLRTDPLIRSSASDALGRIGRAAVPPLLAVLASSPDAEIRAVACETLALTRVREDDVRRALLARLVDDLERTVKDRAASALGDLGFRDAETVRALERSADTDALNAQGYATIALSQLGPEGAEALPRA